MYGTYIENTFCNLNKLLFKKNESSAKLEDCAASMDHQCPLESPYELRPLPMFNSNARISVFI